MDLSAQSTKILMKTTKGDITLMLYDDTPMHRDNMIELVNKKFYDGLLFHRVMPGFMIQGGDPDSKNARPGARLGTGGPGYTVPAEFVPGHFHKKGALAAARIGGPANPQKASSGSQFYLVEGQTWSTVELSRMEASQQHPKFTDEQKKIYMETGGYPPLDYDYTVYGEVIHGMEIVGAITKVKRDQSDRPEEDVKIISMTVIK